MIKEISVIRNITFVISFLLGFAGVVYAQHPSFAYQQNSGIFIVILAGLFLAIAIISFISDFLRDMVRNYHLRRIRDEEPIAPTVTNSSRPVRPIAYRQERNPAELYRMWPLRISFPDSPGNIPGMDNDLVFRLNLTRINNIVEEVISDLKKQK
jgi:hypothetical protein